MGIGTRIYTLIATNTVIFINKEHIWALKYPAIHLLVDGMNVTLKVAGKRSKYTGEIMVTDGRPYGENTYYGRVSAAGEWHKPFKPVQGMDKVENLLIAMATKPAETAAEYGHLTGRCCFCRKALNDERSTEVGYGPICAKHYGLPWG